MFSFCYSNSISDEDLFEKIEELSNACNGLFHNTRLIESKNHRELQLMTEIIQKSTISQLHFQNLYNLISCAIKIKLKYSRTSLHLEANLSERNRKKKHKVADDNFNKLIKVFMKIKPEDIIHNVIDIFETENFWRARRFTVNIILHLLDFNLSGASICHEICNKIEFPNKNIDTKLIVRVLYELLDVYPWPNSDETVAFLERLLNLYYKTLHDNSDNEEDAYFSNLRGSLELCIRHIVKNISNNHLLLIIQRMTAWSIHVDVNYNVITNYGSALEHVAYTHKGTSIANTLTSEMVSLLMEMIASTQQFVSLLGNRVLQYLIDRGNNRMLFNSPKIFFEDMKLNLILKQYEEEDSKFLKLHRELIHDSLTKSILNHHYARLNLETTYCTLCLLAIEIPCGFTAATLCCLMMNLQDNIKKHPDIVGKEASYHIHAIIISVLSFICWIHKAKNFHAYVKDIVMERAQWAPHLNPPLRSTYNFAVHHVLWDKPELFLVDWEVRYGLWKRFRLDETEHTKVEISKKEY